MKAMVHSIYRKGVTTLVLLLVFFLNISYAQSVGDFQSITSGDWSTISTWQICTSTSPVTWGVPGTPPSSANTVYIRAGHVVKVPTSPNNCRSLVVDVGGKLYSGQNASNVYITVWGTNVICNGEIGNGSIADGLGFNFDGITTTITGSGTFTSNRFRKNATNNFTTNLIINTTVTLRWDQASTTQLYNGTCNLSPAASSKFNVTIGSAGTLNCGTSAFPGNVSIDGLDGYGSNGAGTIGASGTITINGVMNVAGSIYIRTNNTVIGDSCSWIVNNGGILKCGSLYTGNSGAAGNFLRVMSGGKLEVTGTPTNILPSFTLLSVLPTPNNAYLFYPGSYCEFSGAGSQYVPAIPNTAIPSSSGGPAANFGYYGNLIISGSGTKTLCQSSLSSYPFNVNNDFTITNATGTAVFDCNNTTMSVSGNWINYNQSGFTEGSGANARVDFKGNTLSTITCPGGEVFNNLRYQKGLAAQIQFNNNVTINDKIDWNSTSNGAFNLNGNDLIIKTNTPASCTNGGTATKYIISERTDNKSRVLWNIGTLGSATSFIIPFGKSATGYIPFTFTVPAGVNADTIKVATYSTPSTNLPWPSYPDNVTNLDGINNPVPDNRDYTVDRFWQVNSSAATAPTLSFVFSYLPSEIPPLASDPLTIGAQNWSNSLSDWQQPVLGSGASGTYNTVAVNNVNYYGPWTMVGYSSPLPVTLLNFDAHASGKNVNVLWSTASEFNNDRFEVERSRDGYKFSLIGTVGGSGTTSEQHSYKFIDTDPFQGLSYYRLTQVDYDGTRTQSKIAAVNFRQGISGNLYPQPAVDFVYWESEDKSLSGELEFSLYTTSGTLVHRETVESQGGGRYSFNTTGLASSIYFLVVSGSGVQQQVPLLINRQ